VAGWVRSLRASRNIIFMLLNDGSDLPGVQVVIEDHVSGFEELKKLGTGSAVKVTGHLVESPGSGQKWDFAAEKVEVAGRSDESYPLQKKRHSFEYLRSIAHLRPRSNTFGAVFRLRSNMAHAVHSFFRERNFLLVHTPVITSNDCEGGGELFRVATMNPEKTGAVGQADFSDDFFGCRTGLTVSGQLEGELFSLAFTDIYTFGPAFRAENSNTPRHAAEFWMVEPEMAFADLYDNTVLAEDFVKYLCRHALENSAEEMAFFDQQIERGVIERIRKVAEADFVRMEYSEAIEHLRKAPVSFNFPVEWGLDLQTEHERYITEQVTRRPVFILNYPCDIKAFYMRRNDDCKTVAAMDLLVPKIGEIIGGSQREERHDILSSAMDAHGVGKEQLWWYLESRKFGSAPHAGFGLGFERLLMYLSGMENIRDVIPFPRTPGNAGF